MASNNDKPPTIAMEKILQDVNVKLENEINEYRTLYIQNQTDIMRERIGTFCLD